MATVISFANHKSGVGKTTLALSLADAFSRANLSVLVVDMDPQAVATNLLYWLDEICPAPVEHLLNRRISIAEAVVQETRLDDVHLIGATLKLSNMEREWLGTFSGPFLLSDALKPVQDIYDVIVIDTPPSLGFLSANALAASDFVFVPIASGSKHSIACADDVLQFIKDARNANSRLTFGGAILTKHDGRQKICKLVAGATKDYYGCVLESSMPPTNDMLKAQAGGHTILQYNEDHPVSNDLKQMALEIMAIAGLATKDAVSD